MAILCYFASFWQPKGLKMKVFLYYIYISIEEVGSQLQAVRCPEYETKMVWTTLI